MHKVMVGALLLSALGSVAVAATPDQWSLEKETNEFDGTTTVTATSPRTSGIYIQVKCDPRDKSSYSDGVTVVYHTRATWPYSDGTFNGGIKYRQDGGDIQRLGGGVSTLGEWFNVADGSGHARVLANTQKYMLGIGYKNRPKTISMENASETINEVLRACDLEVSSRTVGQ